MDHVPGMTARGWLNPNLPAYRPKAKGRRVARISSFFEPNNYGSFGFDPDNYKSSGFDPNRVSSDDLQKAQELQDMSAKAKKLSAEFKKFGFAPGMFASPGADAEIEQRLQSISQPKPVQDIASFSKIPENLGRFWKKLVEDPGALEASELADIPQDSPLFGSWAKEMGLVDKSVNFSKLSKDEKFAALEKARLRADNIVGDYFVREDKKREAEKWITDAMKEALPPGQANNPAVSEAIKRAASSPSVAADIKKNGDPIGAWFRFLAHEFKTPWLSDNTLGSRATTTAKEYAESNYKAVVSGQRDALQNLKTSLLKFNQSARALTSTASSAAKQASPRARALLKRDIEYLSEFRNVVAGMMQDFSIALNDPGASTAPKETKKNAAVKPTPKKAPAPTAPAPVQQTSKQATPEAVVAPTAPPAQTAAQTQAKTPTNYRELVYDSLGANQYAAQQPRQWWEDGARF